MNNDLLALALEKFENELTQWSKAYPLEAFPEPDLAKAHEALKAVGMTLDAVSASNMRHVITILNRDFDEVREALEAAQSQPVGVPIGWQPVPIKPTHEMIERMRDQNMASSLDNWNAYASALAAAPSLPVPLPVDEKVQIPSEFESLFSNMLHAAWIDGWASCRDSEFVGEEAMHDAFNQSTTLPLCLNIDQSNDSVITKAAAAAVGKVELPVVAWQPIETAPKDGTLIVLGAANGVWLGKYLPVYVSGFRPENPWASMMLNHDHMAERRTRPTQWMPLPAAPDAQAAIAAARSQS